MSWPPLDKVNRFGPPGRASRLGRSGPGEGVRYQVQKPPSKAKDGKGYKSVCHEPQTLRSTGPGRDGPGRARGSGSSPSRRRKDLPDYEGKYSVDERQMLHAGSLRTTGQDGHGGHGPVRRSSRRDWLWRAVGTAGSMGMEVQSQGRPKDAIVCGRNSLGMRWWQDCASVVRS